MSGISKSASGNSQSGKTAGAIGGQNIAGIDGNSPSSEASGGMSSLTIGLAAAGGALCLVICIGTLIALFKRRGKADDGKEEQQSGTEMHTATEMYAAAPRPSFESARVSGTSETYQTLDLSSPVEGQYQSVGSLRDGQGQQQSEYTKPPSQGLYEAY